LGRDLRELADPGLLAAAELLVQVARAQGWRVIITSVRRSRRKQAQTERRATIFPAAKPGCSWHEHGMAFDLVIEPHTSAAAAARDPRLRALGEVWESWGGRWGGRYRKPDPVHFQPLLPSLCP